MAYPVPPNIVRASSALCASIIQIVGGSAAVGNSLGWGRQYIHKMMQAGYVPLLSVYEVAQVIQCSCWCLAYHKLMEVFGDASPPFEEVVAKSPLDEADKKRIINIAHKQ